MSDTAADTNGRADVCAARSGSLSSASPTIPTSAVASIARNALADLCSRGSVSRWTGCAGPARASRRGTTRSPGETKRGFCPTCGSHLAAFDYGDTTIGVNISAVDDQHDPRLAPVNQSFRSTAVAWLPQVPDTQPSTAS